MRILIEIGLFVIVLMGMIYVFNRLFGLNKKEPVCNAEKPAETEETKVDNVVNLKKEEGKKEDGNK